MQDLIFVGLFVAMMALTFGYVRGCDRIVGDVGDHRSDGRP